MPANVIHVVMNLDPGGLERLVVRWTQARNGRHPGSTSVCCLDTAGALASELPDGTATALGARRNRFPWDRDAVMRLRMLAKDRNAAVLHSHNLAAQQYAVLAARGTDLRVIHTEHGNRQKPRGVVEYLRERILNRLTDKLVAVSSLDAERFSGRAVVIANGVARHDPLSIEKRAALRRELRLPENRPVIGYVGRLAAIKGVDRLLEAFAKMAANGRSEGPLLLLVGDGPDRSNLEGQARQAGIANQTIFAGFREDARRFYDLMDCFVLPSRSEGASVALLEAMSAGIPVLATDVGSNRQTLMDGEVGVLLPADCGLWADALRRVVEHTDTSREMAERGRQRVLEHFAEESTTQSYEEVYQEGMKDGG